MTKLKIALAQMRCEKGDWPGNLERAERYMAEAAAAGCDIIIFPEMGLSGYNNPLTFPDSVQTIDSPYVQHFVSLTASHKIAASGGFIETNPAGKPFITQILAQGGRILCHYRKVHVVDEEADWFTPGVEMPVFDLSLQGRKIKCSLAVCADSDRPDLFATFARKGVRIVFHSSAPGLYKRRITAAEWQDGYDWYKGYLAERLPNYARDNRLYIAVATQTGATVDEDFPGGSFIFGPDGACLAGTEDYSETLLVYELEVGD
ncbi:MAG TPA: carbon-nitrogen hydrolase family protein [Chloroflexia bacterium]|nr:carbon-nitrogen hydrolase family protein [Chloroflexia bacterium]